MRRIVAMVCALCALAMVMTVQPAAAAVPGKDFTITGCEEYSDSVARLYTAGLDREPEEGGFDFWLTEYTAGRWDLPRMATFFTQSPEFQESYGELTDDGFIRQLYRNVLGREGEAGGIAFWNEQMRLGMDRGTVLLRFAESPENITNSGTTQPALGPFNAGLTGPWTCEAEPQGPLQPTPNPPGGTSPNDQLSMTTPFSISERFSDDSFNGEFVALIEGERRSSNRDEGRCLMLVGTFTPTNLEEGNASSNFDFPELSLIVDGERVRRTAANCDWDPFRELGWRWSLEMGSTLGTAYPFFEEFFLPADGPQNPTSIVAGNPTFDGARYFEPQITSQIPTAPVPPSGPNTFLDSAPSIGESFTIRETFGDVTWQGRVTEIVSAPTNRRVEGTCFFVLGELTPTAIDEGSVTSGFDTPSIGVLNRGRVIDDAGGKCDRTQVEADGYGWILRAEVTQGTTYRFFAEIHIDEGNTPDIQAVIVGRPSSPDALFFK